VIFQSVFGALIGLTVGLAHGRVRSAFTGGLRAPALFGIALGAFASGILALEAMIGRPGSPAWLNYTPAESYVPLFVEPTGSIVSLLSRAGVLMMALIFFHQMTYGWTRQRLVFGPLLFIFGMLVGHVGTPQTPLLWLAQAVISGALFLALYALALHLDLSVMPVLVGTMLILGLLRSAFRASYPGALVGSLLAVLVVAVLAWWWYRKLTRQTTVQAEETGPAPSPVTETRV